LELSNLLKVIAIKFRDSARHIISFSLLFVPLKAIGGSEESLSFSQELGRPVTISYFHPIPGLQEELREVDTEGEIAVSTGWHPFGESDVWVFFLLNETEIETMPIEIIRFLKSEGRLPKEPFSRIEVTYPDGNKKLLLIAMMEPFLKYGLDSYRCKLAFTLKWAISSSPQDLEGDVPMNCP